MKIVMVGVGKVGKTLVSSFVKENHDVVIIDVKREAVEALVNAYDVMGIVGGGLESQTLINAGISEADLFIACTSRDEMNILTCVLAKKLGAKRTVARVRASEYLNSVGDNKEEFGIDLIFNPERRTAFEIANALKFPSAKKVESFADGKAMLVEFEIEKNNPIIGQSLMEISKYMGAKILFAMVQRGKKVFIPNGSFIIEREDRVHIIGAERDISNFCKKIKMFKPRAKSVAIIGGGKIAVQLATELLKSIDSNVKIVEEDKTVCDRLAEILPRATVICGDATLLTLLNEEKVMDVDACVTLTDLDETNVVISLYAKQNGVDKVITKINRSSIFDMAEKIGLETVVSPRLAVANQILGFVRSHKTEQDKGIINFYKLGDDVEAIEFEVNLSFPYLNMPLKNLKLKPNTLICGIVRDQEFILPSGETSIQLKDTLIVVTGIKQITDLREIFR